MKFSDLFNNVKKSTKPSKPVDAYAMVKGVPSNDLICENMLEDEQPSSEVVKHVQSLGKDLGFSDAESKLFWN